MDDAARLERDRKIIASSSFDSDGHGVLYSGPGNHERALNAASTNGAVPIDHTDGGRKLSEPNRYNEYDDFTKADDLNREASKKYCSQLSGNVDTYVVGASEDRIFRDTEQDVLLNNKNVATVNGISRQELQHIHEKDPEAAFNKICEGELVRDRTAAQATGGESALTDLKGREETYREQLERQSRGADIVTEQQQTMSKQETNALQTKEVSASTGDEAATSWKARMEAKREAASIKKVEPPPEPAPSQGLSK